MKTHVKVEEGIDKWNEGRDKEGIRIIMTTTTTTTIPTLRVSHTMITMEMTDRVTMHEEYT